MTTKKKTAKRRRSTKNTGPKIWLATSFEAMGEAASWYLDHHSESLRLGEHVDGIRYAYLRLGCQGKRHQDQYAVEGYSFTADLSVNDRSGNQVMSFGPKWFNADDLPQARKIAVEWAKGLFVGVAKSLGISAADLGPQGDPS